MGNVIHRGKGSFTHVENTVFFDRSLSLKAKGIYCQIRSLEGNPEWVFTIRGFASLVRDGVDAVTAGIRELEEAGYIIRARKRSENGRFLKAEEATWITLDDPAMHGAVADELRAEGFAVLSEFVQGQGSASGGGESRAQSPRERARPRCVPEKAQVVPRTGKSVSGSGHIRESHIRKTQIWRTHIWKTRRYKLLIGWKPLNPDQRLSPSPPPRVDAADARGEGEAFEPYRRGRVPRGVRAAVRRVAQARDVAEVQARLPRRMAAAG